MTQQIVIGIAILGAGIVLLAVVAVGNAETWAYYLTALIGLTGVGFLVTALVPPGIPRAAAALPVFLSACWTFVLFWKARPKPPGQRPTSG